MRLFTVSSILIFIFIFYWIFTIVFTLPNTSVVIGEYYQEYTVFRKYFNQNWAFFAPPPQFNVKIEYVYIDTTNKSNDIYIIDALSVLEKKSKEFYLLDGSFTNLSWQLTGYATNIVEMYQNEYEFYKQINKEKATIEEYHDQFNKMLIKAREYKILQKHATILAKKANIDFNYFCYDYFGWLSWQ